MDAAKILQDAAWVRALLLDRIQLIARNTSEMQRLDAEGRIYASPHWREGRYLYLIHPSEGGRRVREYVGAEPKKIAKAMRGVQNAQNFDDLERQTCMVSRSLERIAFTLQGLIRELENLADLDLATEAVRPKPIGDNDADQVRRSVTNRRRSTMVTEPRQVALDLSPKKTVDDHGAAKIGHCSSM